MIRAPRWAAPWLRHTPRPRSGAQAQALSRERWPGEGRPLGATPRRGAARPCVFADLRRPRLPAWAFLVGSGLADTAATQPAFSTGCGERAPRPTPGRWRRVLAPVQYTDWQELLEPRRQKPSPTAHWPTSVRGHRR